MAIHRGRARRRLIGLAAGAATLVAAAAHPAVATAAEADARRLVAAATGNILVIVWSPLNVMRLALGPDGRADVIGTGIRHCKGPHPARWHIGDGMLCLSTPWSSPCFAVDAAGRDYALKESGDRPVTTRIDTGPLGGC